MVHRKDSGGEWYVDGGWEVGGVRVVGAWYVGW